MSKPRTALISVYDKTGIVGFAQELVALGFTIIASGGTAKALKTGGIEVKDVAELVGGDPILGHRVVTLSRQVHAGLLARPRTDDADELAKMKIPWIDLVCVDMYPLQVEIARPDSTWTSVIEQTDIGGPTMIRSAAKGCRLVICDPKDRQMVLDWLKAGEPGDAFMFKEELCAKGEFTVAKYVMASAAYRSSGKYIGIFGTHVLQCKYGENAWQAPAALFSTDSDDPVALDKFRVVEGTPPSYNNWCDIDRLLQTATHMAAARDVNGLPPWPLAIGVKHGNPCGATWNYALMGRILTDMIEGDELAIFGGLILTTFTIDEDGAVALAKQKFDGVIAPDITPRAIEILRRKGNKCRFIVNPVLNFQTLAAKHLDTAPRFRYVRGGFLRQPNYTYVLDLKDKRLAWYGPELEGEKRADLLLAWAIGSTSNSNTITLVKDGALIGNGTGQQDRVGAATLADLRAKRAKHSVRGAVAYSDSFFPFPDGPQVLIDAGVRAILTSSGSINDQKTIDLCAERHISLIMVPDAVGRGFFGH